MLLLQAHVFFNLDLDSSIPHLFEITIKKIFGTGTISRTNYVVSSLCGRAGVSSVGGRPGQSCNGGQSVAHTAGPPSSHDLCNLRESQDSFVLL